MSANVELMQKKLQLLQLKKQQRMNRTHSSQNKTPTIPKAGMSFDEKVLGGVNALGQGASLNLADEAGSGLAALAVKGGDVISGNENSAPYGEIYDSMMEGAERDRTAYREESPFTSAGLEMAGAAATGGVLGARFLGTPAVRGLSKARQLAVAAATGGAEGIIAGAGSGNDFDSRLENAKTGGMFGAGMPLALGGLGHFARYLSDAFTLPKMTKNLINGEQPPINIAHPESVRGRVLRDNISPALGGHNQYIESLPYLEKAQEGVKTLGKRGSHITEATRQVQRTQKEASDLLTDQVTKSGAKSVKDAGKAVSLKAEADVEGLQSTFRKNMTAASTPQNMSDEGRKILANPNSSPQEVAAALKQNWSDNGFDVVKNKYFDIEDKEFKGIMTGLFDDSADLKKKAGNYMASFRANLKYFKDKNSGQISGKNFMALRNVYATAANDAGMDATEAKIQRTIANKIDGYMTGNLPDADRAAFLAEKTAYDNHANLLAATGAAKQKGGKFTDTEWLSTTNTKRAAVGGGPNQMAADANREAVKLREAQKLQDLEKLPEIEKAAGLNKAAGKQASDAKEAIVQRGRKIEARAAKGLEKAKERLAVVNMAMPQARPHIGSQFGNTAAIAALPTFLMGPTTGIPAAISMAKGLTSKGGNRFISGQMGDEFLDAASSKSFAVPFTRGTATPPFRNPELRLADILRQGTAAGTVESQVE